MSEKIVQLNEEIIKSELKELVRSSVEETLNGMLEQEAQQLLPAPRNMNAAQSVRVTAAVTTAGT